MTRSGQNKNTNTSVRKKPLNEFISTFDEKDIKKVTEKITDDLMTEESIESMADFGEAIAHDLNLDWDNMSVEKQSELTISLLEYYSEFLKNFITSITDEDIQRTLVMYIKSGFSPKIIEGDIKLKTVIDLFNFNFINVLKKELN